ncbi:MAG: hypothetical protein AABX51_07705 [Nanoarchaeota archaeon]
MAKYDQTQLRTPVFFLSMYWFFAAYVVTNLIVFMKYGADKTFEGFMRQLLFVNITYDLYSLLLAYAIIIVLASLFSLLIIYIETARVAVMVGGGVVGIFLGIFAYAMSLYYASQPCTAAGCIDLQFKLFIVHLIYLVYGNFVASQIPVAYALTKNPKSIGEFVHYTLKPGIFALSIYTILGIAIVFSVT